MHGAFVWARRALNRPFRRFPARAVAPKYGFGEAGDDEVGVGENAVITADIELIDFENEKESWELKDSDAKLASAEAKKVLGNEKVRQRAAQNQGGYITKGELSLEKAGKLPREIAATQSGSRLRVHLAGR